MKEIIIKHYAIQRFGQEPSFEQYAVARKSVGLFIEDTLRKIKLTFFVMLCVFSVHFAVVGVDYTKATYWAILWLAYNYMVVNYKKITD